MLATFQYMFGNDFWRNAVLEVNAFTYHVEMSKCYEKLESPI